MKTINWIKIAADHQEIHFNDNNIATIQVNGKLIAIGRYNNKMFAVAPRCPHAGGMMTDGWIDNKGNIVCPLHGYRFNMETGRNVSGEGYNLKHWPVEDKEDGIFIGLEDASYHT